MRAGNAAFFTESNICPVFTFVAIGPGLTPFTVTPCGANSSASALVSPNNPVFEAQ